MTISSLVIADSRPTETASYINEVSTRMIRQRRRIRKITYLANGKMAEPTDELALVQCISGLLHATHRDHILVKLNQTVFCYFNVKGRGVGVISPKRVFV